MLNKRNTMCGMWQQTGQKGKGENTLNYGIYSESNTESLRDFYQTMTWQDLWFGKTILKERV